LLIFSNSLIFLADPKLNCLGINTYNEDLSDNGFLSELGEGLQIVRVVSGRGLLPENDPAGEGLDYYDPYYGPMVYHKVGDTVRIGCKLGYSNAIGKDFSGAKCLCSMGSCAFALNNAAYRCVPDTTAAIPVWQGGNFNYVKGVYDSFFIMKARIMNLMSVEKWDWDQYDHVTNEFAVSPEYWTTAKFTLFVFCPFDVTRGGLNSDGIINFPDFYSSEHSADGKLWSFLSREPTVLDKFVCSGGECGSGNHYFKGYIGWSPKKNERGPMDIASDDYTCEIGILPEHRPTAIADLVTNFDAFAGGNFDKMTNYLRSAPFKVYEL